MEILASRANTRMSRLARTLGSVPYHPRLSSQQRSGPPPPGSEAICWAYGSDCLKAQIGAVRAIGFMTSASEAPIMLEGLRHSRVQWASDIPLKRFPLLVYLTLSDSHWGPPESAQQEGYPNRNNDLVHLNCTNNSSLPDFQRSGMASTGLPSPSSLISQFYSDSTHP